MSPYLFCGRNFRPQNYFMLIYPSNHVYIISTLLQRPPISTMINRMKNMEKRVKTTRKLLILLMATATYSLVQAADYTPARVIRVIDGDTLKIEINGEKENVRLIGVDTPESKPNPKALRDSRRSGTDINTLIKRGEQAADFTRSHVKPGDTVKIEFDVKPRDRYNRFLGYVYLADGRMLNEVLLKAGYANLMTVPPNVKYQQRFRTTYRNAGHPSADRTP